MAVVAYINRVRSPAREFRAGQSAFAELGSLKRTEAEDGPRDKHASTYDAALQVGCAEPRGAAFVSCNRTRMFEVIEQAEVDLGLPVLSSDRVPACQLPRIDGLEGPVNSLSQIFKSPLGSDPSIPAAIST